MSVATTDAIKKWKDEHSSLEGKNTHRTSINLTCREVADISLQRQKLGFDSRTKFIRWAIYCAANELKHASSEKVDDQISPRVLENETFCKQVVFKLSDNPEKFDTIENFIKLDDDMTFQKYLKLSVSEYLTATTTYQNDQETLLDEKRILKEWVDELARKAQDATLQHKQFKEKLINEYEDGRIEPQKDLYRQKGFSEELIKQLVSVTTLNQIHKYLNDNGSHHGYPSTFADFLLTAVSRYLDVELKVENYEKEIKQLEKKNRSLSQLLNKRFIRKIINFFRA